MLCGWGHITGSGLDEMTCSGVSNLPGAAHRPAPSGGWAKGISRKINDPSGPASADTTPLEVLTDRPTSGSGSGTVHAAQHSIANRTQRRLGTVFLIVWWCPQSCVMRYDLKKGTDHSRAATRADSGIRASGRSVVHVEVGDAVIDPDHQQFIAHREHDRADE